jgi:hypothetical protein
VPSKEVWARRPKEPARAYESAWEYFRMGPSRSIDKVAAALFPGGQKGAKRGPKAKQLRKLSSKWQWVKRAAAYDAWIEAKNLDAAELFAIQEAQKWAQRERDRRERKYAQGDLLLEAAETMLKFPLTEVTRTVAVDETGRETQIQVIKPARWAKRDVVRFMLTGHVLGEQAIRNEGAVTSEIEEQDNWDKTVPFKPGGRPEE